jgi:hypothetical protein
MPYNSDFKEFLVLLNKFEVKYLVIGGYAVSVYSYPLIPETLISG